MGLFFLKTTLYSDSIRSDITKVLDKYSHHFRNAQII